MLVSTGNVLMKRSYCLIIMLVISAFLSPSIYAESETTILNNYVTWLKTIKNTEDGTYTDNTVTKMNEQWIIFSQKKQQYNILIINQLKNELLETKPNQVVLLDLALYLTKINSTPSQSLILNSIKVIDINNPVIQKFSFLYYQLLITYSYSSPKDLLPILDNVFLPGKNNGFHVFEAKNSIGVAMYRLHAFGSYGIGAVDYLLSQLLKSENSLRKDNILSILRYICTIKCNKSIYPLIKGGAKHTVLSHVTYALLDTGGPEGKELFLSLPISKYQGKDVDWIKKEIKFANKLKYSYFVKKLEYEHEKDSRTYSKNEFITLMDKMIVKPSLFLRSHPHDFLNSKLDKEFLIKKIIIIRKTLFRYSTVHGRDYVRQANEIMNALLYKP